MTTTNAYFAEVQPEVNGAVPVIGWASVGLPYGYTSLSADEKQKADASMLTQIEAQSPGSSYVRVNLTDDQFAARPLVNPQLVNGVLGQAPRIYAPAPSLKEQATAKLDGDVAQNRAELDSAGLSFGPQYNAYVKALVFIKLGKDTTSTSLPVEPSDPTE